MEQSWYSYSVTDIGRRQINQDATYANDQQKLWLVADGMGGHSAGEKASLAIVDAFTDIKLSKELGERIVLIEEIGRQVNEQLKSYSDDELNGEYTGSTLVLFTVCQDLCMLVWAGDSRCYKLNCERISQLSWDHSHVEELLKSGDITVEQAQHSKLSNIITRAVGAHSEIHFDHLVLPNVCNDIYLLCSDGLTNEISGAEISEVVSKHGCSQKSIDKLLKLALIHGGQDNISIILISNQHAQYTSHQKGHPFSAENQHIYDLSQRYYHSEIDKGTYYHQLSNLVNLVSDEYNNQITTPDQKISTSNQGSVLNENALPTNSCPKVTNFSTLKYRLVKLGLICIILLILFALIVVQLT